MYLKLNVTPLAGPAGSFDGKNGFSVRILDGKPRIDEGALLLDPANSGTRRRLDLYFLETTEATPIVATKGPHKMNHLHAHTIINHVS